MNRLSKYCLAFTTLFPLLSCQPALAQPNTKVSVGFYFSANSDTHPLILTSNDQGNSWSYTAGAISGLPKGPFHGTLFDSTCTGNQCTSVGLYSKDSGFSNDYEALRPLLLISQDNANTWSFVDHIENMPAYKAGYLVASTCFNNLCVIGGNDSLTGQEDDMQPLLLVSNNSGQTWSAANVADLPTLKKSTYISAYCDANHCTLSGLYLNDQKKLTPFFVYSADAGQSWNYSTADLPTNYSMGWLNSTSCEGATCLASGAYYKNHANRWDPLLMVSQDFGKTWIAKSTPKQANGYQAAIGACSENTCIEMLAGTSILMSQDHGETWSFKTLRSVIPKQMKRVDMTTISCHDNFCIIGGANYEKTQTKFFFLLSHDSGKTWTFSDNVSASLDSPPLFDMLAGASCEENNCVAVGGEDVSSTTVVPIILHSADHGQTWVRINLTNTIPSLVAGQLNQLTGSNDQSTFLSGTQNRLLFKLHLPQA